MKQLKVISSFVLLLLVIFTTMACKKSETDVIYLRVYNWEDYIDDGTDDGEKIANSVMEDWEEDYFERTGIKVKVIYNTFETNEYMLNVLKTGSEHYDLVCPSDYIIQKMISEDMLEKLTIEDDSHVLVPNYDDYASPYIRKIFNEHTTLNKKTNEELAWTNYAIPYMWGTMGFTYNMDTVETEDAQTWGILWNTDYAKKSTAKNSVHDTYVAGVMYAKRDELMALKEEFESGAIDAATYNSKIDAIMNDVSDETINLVEEKLIEMKNNFYGFEVDNGKTDILNGTITINFCWSGDGVYSMDEAEEGEEGKQVFLGYEVPIEGSNVFFDGWVMPKGANVELAQDFLNYMCSPETAARNMDFIGYTSVIAGDEIWELLLDNYSVEDGEEGEDVDLTYFFDGTLSDEYLTDGKAIVTVAERGRQFDAQYPSEETLLRCAVMKDFGEQNEKVLIMWENVKCGEIGAWLWVGYAMIACFVVLVVFFEVNHYKKKNRHRFNK